MIVTPIVAIIVFIIIVVVSALIAWRMGLYTNYDKGSFHTFIAILTGLGVFVTFMFYYNLVELQAQQQKLASIQELSRINNTVLSALLQDMNDSVPIIPNFVLSITPLTNAVCCDGGFTGITGITGINGLVKGITGGTCIVPVPPDPVTANTCTQKMVISYRIFGLWQDFIMSKAHIPVDGMPYVSNFLQRANSAQLYDQWTAARLDFAPNTQIFGDLLFQYALPITNQTPATYEIVAQQLMASPAYQKL